jgi:folate-binding protein YgfZ
MSSQEHYRALRQTAGLVDRSTRGRVRLTGRDRRSYLQGLLTNDIEALTAGTGCYACLLTPQGRMIADMRVEEDGDAILMDLERDVVATVRDHLDRFVFSEDVQVADVSASLAQLGIYGPSAPAVVSRALGGALPDESLARMAVFDNVWVESGHGRVLIVRSDDIGVQGFDVFVDADRREALSRALQESGAAAVEESVAEVCRVEAGRPVFHKDMDEETIPLEAGIEDRAISLTKGCYVGQEIIIRVLHRGHGRVARRLVGLTLDPAADVPVRGDRIRSGDREIGEVTSAVRSLALERPIAMGYVHRDFVEPLTAVEIISGDRGSPAAVTRLPFVA